MCGIGRCSSGANVAQAFCIVTFFDHDVSTWFFSVFSTVRNTMIMKFLKGIDTWMLSYAFSPTHFLSKMFQSCYVLGMLFLIEPIFAEL